MIDYFTLKEKGANDKQLTKLKEIYPKLIERFNTDPNIWCLNGKVRVYLEGAFIAIDYNGIPKVMCGINHYKKKIEEAIK